MDSNTKMMTYFLPVIFAVWAIKWSPSILIYWITFSLIAVGEQTIILRGIRVAMEQPKGQSKSRIVEEELPQRELPEQIGTHEQSQVTKEKKEKEVKPVKTKKNPRFKQEKK
ncbi:MAG: YidC/Oxa1 family membrane protein insertase [Caldiserica bacterium]|nr:YidC/Oxa1 family membrane protein insertase [Caldisericota bacterium]